MCDISTTENENHVFIAVQLRKICLKNIMKMKTFKICATRVGLEVTHHIH
jgi:hypothetical protein